ncbi:MAG: T9SS type A sorting domain-containing protein [FCB group bacterium]|nr:T9SS type A sorting domain-containing protein [FCB group bacterium]
MCIRRIGFVPILIMVGLVCGVLASTISAMVRQPYLQNVTENSVKVMWGTDATSGTLYWGPSPGEYDNSVSSTVFADRAGKQIHTATIDGLDPGQKVYYYVISGTDTVGMNDSTYYAVTAPAGNAPFRFAFYSDSHAYNSVQGKVIRTMVKHKPDIVLHGGDKVTTGKNLFEFNSYFFYYGAPLMKNTPLFSTVGNHDMTYPQSGNGYEADIANYRDLFDLPVNNSPYDGTEDYYSFDYGSVHFVSIHAQRAQRGGYQNGYFNETYNDSMLAWLKRDLQGTDKPWKVVFFHKPIFMNWLEPQGWDTILEQNGVQLVLNGHLHYYYAHNRNSVTYIIAATSGGGLGNINWWEWSDYYIGAFSDYNFVQVDVTPAELKVKVFDSNDVLRHWINVDPSGNATYPPLGPVDDFDEYADDSGVQGAWRWIGVVQGVPMDAIQVYLDTDSLKESNVMRVESSFSEDGRDGYAYVGIPGFWNWTDYKAIKLWVKANYTGFPNQYFQVRLHEGSDGEKWKSPQVSLSNIAPEGEYVYLYFDDFTKYYNGNGSLANNKLDLNAIVNFFIIPGYNGTATDKGTSTIYIDDITVVVDSLSTVTDPALPGKFGLHQNYPNPFNPVTTIQYDIPVTGEVQLTVYDVSGREIATLVNDRVAAGTHTVRWDGRNRDGGKVASGIYIYRLKADNYVQSKKLLLIK